MPALWKIILSKQIRSFQLSRIISGGARDLSRNERQDQPRSVRTGQPPLPVLGLGEFLQFSLQQPGLMVAEIVAHFPSQSQVMGAGRGICGTDAYLYKSSINRDKLGHNKLNDRAESHQTRP